MKLAYVTAHDASDIRNWSGIVYYMPQSLQEQGILVDYIDSLKEKNELLFKGKQLLYSSLLKKNYSRHREPLVLKNYAQQVANKLAKLTPDLVFSEGTAPIAYLECEQPVVFWTDATFAGMVGFYPGFSNLCQETIEDGNKMEKLALEKCKLAIYSSDWAAKTAIENYQVSQSKVKVVPFGANIECDRSLDDIKAIVDSRPSSQCNLLFLGVDWFRKGGDIALEVARELNQQGLNTKLTVVGCQPITNKPLPTFVKSLGFISKDSKEGRRKFDQIISDSHFLVLPSQAECYGIVFCEANSFGVPCIATDVGGITTVIKENLNGKTFSKDAKIADYCAYISNLFTDYSQYKSLALSSFSEYQLRLNWSVAGKAVKKLLMELIE
jgi:glycosyltransferase involved in cell wall biosynthesis